MPETISRAQLQELIRHITQMVLQEFKNIDPATASIEKMNNGGKDKMSTKDGMDADSPQNAADAKKSKSQAIRTADMNLKGTKTQSDYFTQQLKQNKLKVTAQQKELQNLRAGKTIGSGGAGSISSV